ncbi:MAG: hypothetical protein CL521_01115 [Actinobacteria bacterium]|nr:hypothetical protein [Actinomycetota bacterium]
MQKLLIFTGMLAFSLGFFQLFAPVVLERLDSYFKKLISVGDKPIPINTRMISGLILTLAGIVLIYLAFELSGK